MKRRVVPWEAKYLAARVDGMLLECEEAGDGYWRWRVLTCNAYRFGAARSLPMAMAQAENAAGLR